MKPLFTIHAGEYLVGSHIAHHFKHVNVWVPTRDTGVDLLVSDRRNHQTVSLQVKHSKDYLPRMGPNLQWGLRACGWWTVNSSKLLRSEANYWVFVLQGFATRSFDFVVIPPKHLYGRLKKIHGRKKVIQTYLWVTKDKRCWETRGLRRNDQLSIALNNYDHKTRDFTAWLNEWSSVAKLNRAMVD